MGQFQVLYIDDLRRLKGSRLVYGGRRPLLQGVSTDSRKAGRGDFFIALKGDRFDGHDFIPQVLSQGAVGAMVSHEGFLKHRDLLQKAFTVIVEDPLTALGEWGHLHRRRHDLPVVAVAGSNGKTGTKDLLAWVLSGMGPVCATQGNLNNHIGVPLTLLGLRPEHRFAVIEIGTNHFGEVAGLCEMAEPTHGVITSIGHEHLEFFKNISGVEKAEFELADDLAKSGGTLFGPLHDPRIEKRLSQMAKTWEPKKVRPFSLEGLGGGQGRRVGKSPGLKAKFKTLFVDFDDKVRPGLILPKYGNKKKPIRCGATGIPGAWAAAAAAAIGYALGMEQDAIGRRLASFHPPANKRMEWSKFGGVTVLNDAYNANLDSMMMGLTTLSHVAAKGSHRVVLGDMLELGDGAAEAHAKVGLFAKKLGLDVWTFGPLSKATAKAAKAMDRHYEDRKALAADLKSCLAKGDLLYLKGSRGMRLELILEELDKGAKR